MTSTNDLNLLGEFTRHQSQDAFTALVQRHLNLVYCAALRRVRSPQLAEEVAQSVFTDLARSAARLKPDTILTAWLYQVTRRTAIDVVRSEARRQFREQIALEMNAMNANADDWTQIEPLLDEAMDALDDTDRTAVLLRYFENRSLREVGQTLGTTDDTARKRVNRAIEHLREFLTKHGVTVGATGLVVVLSANAVQAAPIGLAATISTAAALAGTTIATTATLTTVKAIAMTTLQKTVITATIAAAIGTGMYQAHQAATLRSENRLLQQQQAPLAEQLQQLQRERDDATNRLASLAEEMAKRKNNEAELLKLRGEVAMLRADAGFAPGEASMKTWSRQVAVLRQKLEQMPDQQIPELQFATEKDWANAVWGADLNTEDGVREAFSKLREEAENKFLNDMTGAALKKYLAAHDGILPADLFALKPYFDAPVTDAMLERYQLLQSGKPDVSAPIVRLTASADPDYDSNHQISLTGASGGRFNRVQTAVEIAAAAFAKDNNGQMPTGPDQIAAYLTKPIDAATIQKYLAQIASDPPLREVSTLSPALKAYSDANKGGSPNDDLELVPYLTTPDQKAAFLKVEGLPPEAAVLEPALKAYVAAHAGEVPTRPSDLLPYVKTAEEKTALQKVEQMRNGQR